MHIKGRQFLNMDADAGIFFQRELEAIKSKTYDRVYPELLARRLFPLDQTTDSGAEYVTYRSWDHVGMAKLIHSYSEDLPNVEVTASETVRKIYGEALAFSYSIQDIRAARFSNKPLEQKKANACRRQLLALENTLAFDGDAATSIPAFINNANFNVVTPVDGAATNTTWATKTPDEILDDINSMVSIIRSTTNGVETPNTLILPEAQHTLISIKRVSTVSDTTIREFILMSNPWIKSIIPVYNLAGACPASGTYDSQDCAILYDRNPDKLWLETPQDVEFLPVQEIDLKYKTPGHMRTAGVIVAYPKSVSQLNGI